MNKVNSVRELEVYQAAFTLQQEIFACSRRFPKEETYALTDQIRRSSRSVGGKFERGVGQAVLSCIFSFQAYGCGW
jgi:four helix bundle protein